jgi:hypothetical protein
MSAPFIRSQFIKLSRQTDGASNQYEGRMSWRAWRSVNKNLFAVPLRVAVPPRRCASFRELVDHKNCQ